MKEGKGLAQSGNIRSCASLCPEQKKDENEFMNDRKAREKKHLSKTRISQKLKSLLPPFKPLHIIFARILLHQPPQLLPIIHTILGHSCIDVRKQLSQRRMFLSLRARNRIQDLSPNAPAGLLFHVLVPDAAKLHPLAQAGDGIIAAFPVLDFDAGAVGETVVARAVVRDAVAHGFDEDGLAPAGVVAGESHLARFARDAPHGEDVVAVYPDGVDAVADAAAGDAVAAVLF